MRLSLQLVYTPGADKQNEQKPIFFVQTPHFYLSWMAQTPTGPFLLTSNHLNKPLNKIACWNKKQGHC